MLATVILELEITISDGIWQASIMDFLWRMEFASNGLSESRELGAPTMSIWMVSRRSRGTTIGLYHPLLGGFMFQYIL